MYRETHLETWLRFIQTEEFLMYAGARPHGWKSSLTLVHAVSSVKAEVLVKYLPTLHDEQKDASPEEKLPLGHCQNGLKMFSTTYRTAVAARYIDLIGFCRRSKWGDCYHGNVKVQVSYNCVCMCVCVYACMYVCA
jgi:hypothetical protein